MKKFLTTGSVKGMEKAPELERGKVHVLQVAEINTNPQCSIKKFSFKLSDGCYYIKGIAEYSKEVAQIKQYDVIELTEFRVALVKSYRILIMQSFRRIYTKIAQLIGKPLELADYFSTPTTREAEIPESAEFVRNEPKEPTTIVQSICPIRALSLYAADWTIKVRVTKKVGPKECNSEKMKGKSKVMILELLDAEGTEILAGIFNEDIDLLGNELVEGGVFLISDGTVRLSVPIYGRNKYEYMLFFGKSTKLVRCFDDTTIPPYTFTNYFPLSSLPHLSTEELFDTIGIIKSVQNTSRADHIDLILYDHTNSAAEITLCKPFQTRTIIGLKNVKLETVSTAVLPRLKTSDLTTLIIHPVHQVVPALEKIAVPFSLYCPNLNIAEYWKTLPSEKMHTITATVQAISYENGFCYPSCKKCKRRLAASQCTYCKGIDTEYTYAFPVRITDGTGFIWVQAFGFIAELMLGCKPQTLLEKMQQGDRKEFRRTFERARYKTYTMKIKAKQLKERTIFQAFDANPLAAKQNNEAIINKLKVYEANTN